MGCCKDDDKKVSDIVPVKGAPEGTELSMSKEAAEFIQQLCEKQDKKNHGLKIEVVPGGCAGFQYYMDFLENGSDGDNEFEFHGVKLFIDPESLGFIKGSSIDFVQTLEQTGLKINNPNITRQCNCGKSVC